jgi:hypothetical protein
MSLPVHQSNLAAWRAKRAKRACYWLSTEMGVKLHDCEGDMVCKSTNEMIPYFNAPIYLENKTQVRGCWL